MIKIYTPLQRGLGDWIKDSVVSSFEDADVVLLPGGSDVDPALYGHTRLASTHVNSRSDAEELGLLNRTIDANKFVIGICKGSQLVTARAGGWLIQDVTGHGGSHEIDTFDGKKLRVTSTHHQMCYPYDLPQEDYQLLGWARELSSRYLIQGDKDLADCENWDTKAQGYDENDYFKEPDVIFYPKIRALAIQNHPEYGNSPAETNKWLNEVVLQFINA